jgi:hypothetical protein
MAADPTLTLETVQQELAAAASFAAAAGLDVETSELTEVQPRFVIVFRNASGERFFAEFDCRDYPMYPPTSEFLDATHVARGQRGLYPVGFHPMPCVCARYNRKAYVERGGPHADWRLVDWQLPTGSGVAVDSITMMLSDLHGKIARSTGRMG